MTTATTRTIYKGSVEYLAVRVVADVTLADDLPVALSFDRDSNDPAAATWHDAAWEGAAGTTRTASLLVNDAILGSKSARVFVRITDDPEVPIVQAGVVHRA